MLKERLLETKKSWIPIVIVLSFLFAAIYNLFDAGGTNLPSYVEEEIPFEREEAEFIPPDTYAYNDEEWGFTLLVPEGWRQVTRQGHTTFINQDGASLQVQRMDYIPSLNMASATSVSNDVVAAGGIMEDFARLAPDAYAVVYSFGETVYMEYCTWSREAAVQLQFGVRAETYDSYYSTMLYVLDAFHWEKENPLPDGFLIYYNAFGSFEFGLPAHWSGAITSDGVYAATNPSAGSVMYVSVVESDATFHSVGQAEYVSYMSENRPDFVLRSFANDGTSIMAEAVYAVGDTQYALIQMRKCSGQFQYAFSFECPMAAFNEEVQAFWTALGLFRFF